MGEITQNQLEQQNKPLVGQLIKRQLNANQRLFCRKYIELSNNATQAYKQIYDPHYFAKNGKHLTDHLARSMSSRLMSRVSVLEYVEKLQIEAARAADVSIHAVLGRFKVWAEFDPRDVFEWKKTEIIRSNGSPWKPPRFKMALFAKSMEDIPPEAWECIESVEEGRDGFKIKVINKLKANIELAKYLGMDKKVIENTGNVIMSFDKQDENL